MKKIARFGVALAVLMAGPVWSAVDITKGTWFGTDGTNGTLRGRDAAGLAVNLLVAGEPNPALRYVYDTRLNLTWQADWRGNGQMSWVDANAWAASLTDSLTWSRPGRWTLPPTLDIGGLVGQAGCTGSTFSGGDCGFNVYADEAQRRSSPLAHVYYDTLGNLGVTAPSGATEESGGLRNTGPFVNIGLGAYWSVSAPPFFEPTDGWYFGMSGGQQGHALMNNHLFAVAVRPGDIAIMPSPTPGGDWEFLLPRPGRWYDPPVVAGFRIVLAGGGEFVEVIAPAGFENLSVIVDGVVVADDLDGDESYFFAPGVSAFDIVGIDPLLDPDDPGFGSAFPLFLDFTSPPGASMMTWTPIAVPEPAERGMLFVGLPFLGMAVRRRWRC